MKTTSVIALTALLYACGNQSPPATHASQSPNLTRDVYVITQPIYTLNPGAASQGTYGFNWQDMEGNVGCATRLASQPAVLQTQLVLDKAFKNHLPVRITLGNEQPCSRDDLETDPVLAPTPKK